MKFPRTVPQWLIDEVEAFSGDLPCENFLTAIASPKTVEVWPSLRKRSNENRPFALSLLRLAAVMEDALRAAANHRLPELERKKCAQRITKLAGELDSAINKNPEFYEMGLWSMEAGLGEYVVADSWLKETSERLKKLSQAAMHWGEQVQVLPRPRDPDAARLFFFRRLTAHFQKEYEQPLREQTLALASVFYECDKISTADISRLAPV